MCGCFSHSPLLGTWPATQACALDWELNRRPFGSQASPGSTEPHQPGLTVAFLNYKRLCKFYTIMFENIKEMNDFSEKCKFPY